MYIYSVFSISLHHPGRTAISEYISTKQYIMYSLDGAAVSPDVPHIYHVSLSCSSERLTKKTDGTSSNYQMGFIFASAFGRASDPGSAQKR